MLALVCLSVERFDTYMLFTGREVRMGKNCARGLLKTKGTVFSYTDRLSPVNNMFIFFPTVNWLYRLQMGLFTQLLSFNGLPRRLPTSCKKSSQRTSNSDSRQKKDVLKNICFSNYFMLAVFISLIKFSKIVFAV